MKKLYIQPETKVEQFAIDAICLAVSATPANSSEVLAPEREETEWEEI